jgi:putative ATP-dependent endonuclease of OLD family
VALVEGVTDVTLLRQFGRAWAGGDQMKGAFVNALSIIPAGHKVGAWPVRLLATKDAEICDRVAVMRDSDQPMHEEPRHPSWLVDHSADVVAFFPSHPTLEPAITHGNEAAIAEALKAIGIEPPEQVTPESIHALFRSRIQIDNETIPAGKAAGRKADFALAMAEALQSRLDSDPSAVEVPGHMRNLFDFLYDFQAEPQDFEGLDEIFSSAGGTDAY